MAPAAPIPAVMILGTNSDAGKSVLVAGLCRSFARRGLAVQPFKPQNMSNNAAAVPGGGEIGRAQALQARAAGVEPCVDHNPVLLKPESDTGAQVVVQGRPLGRLEAARFGGRRDELLPRVLDSFDRLAVGADLVVIEGAGSPAETNLRDGDIANLGFAAAAGVPAVMAGDIDRGGVIAALVGTHAVLSTEDRARIRGFLINKLRGDIGLFDAGLAEIAARTGWPSLGVVTWSRDLTALPAEDAVELERPAGSPDRAHVGDGVTVAVPMLSRIANFDDVDPLRLEPGVEVVMVPPGRPLPVADLVLVPGTKATIADLRFLRSQGWDVDLAAHVRRGGRVLGLCGGYQLLGRTIDDPTGIEGRPERVDGLGLLDVDTVLQPEKVTRPVTGQHAATGQPIAGYEIHVGRSTGPDCARPLLHLQAGGAGPGVHPDGAVSADGLVAGGYVHGLFTTDGFRQTFLASLGAEPSDLRYDDAVDAALDRWADQLEAELDVDALLAIARSRRWC